MAVSVSSFAAVANWFATASPATVTGRAWNSGDVVVVVGGSENGDTTLSTPTNANLTFTLRASANNPTTPEDDATAFLWTAVAGSSQTAQTISVAAAGGQSFGFGVWVLPGASGSFANASGDLTESAFTFTPTADSAVIYAHFDWAATTGKTITAGTGTATERADFGDGSNYGGYLGDWVNVTASSASFGISSYTGVQIARVMIEILATGGGGPAPTLTFVRPLATPRTV